MEAARDKIERLFFQPKPGFAGGSKASPDEYKAPSPPAPSSSPMPRRKHGQSKPDERGGNQRPTLSLAVRGSSSETKLFSMPFLPPIEPERPLLSTLGASRSMPSLYLLDSQPPDSHLETRLQLPPAWEMGLKAPRDRDLPSHSAPTSPEHLPALPSLRQRTLTHPTRDSTIEPSVCRTSPPAQVSPTATATATVSRFKPGRLSPLTDGDVVDGPQDFHLVASQNGFSTLLLHSQPRFIAVAKSSVAVNAAAKRWMPQGGRVGFLIPSITGMALHGGAVRAVGGHGSVCACPTPTLCAAGVNNRSPTDEASCGACGGVLRAASPQLQRKGHRWKKDQRHAHAQSSTHETDGPDATSTNLADERRRDEHERTTATAAAVSRAASHDQPRPGDAALERAGVSPSSSPSHLTSGVPAAPSSTSVPLLALPPTQPTPAALDAGDAASRIPSICEPSASGNMTEEGSAGRVLLPPLLALTGTPGVMGGGLVSVGGGQRRTRLDSQSSIPPRLSLGSVGGGRVSMVDGEQDPHLFQHTLRASFSLASGVPRRGSTISLLVSAVATDALPSDTDQAPLVTAARTHCSMVTPEGRRRLESTESLTAVGETAAAAAVDATVQSLTDSTRPAHRRAPPQHAFRSVHARSQVVKSFSRSGAGSDAPSEERADTGTPGLVASSARRMMFGQHANGGSLRARAVALALESDDDALRQPRASVSGFLAEFCVLSPEQLAIFRHLFDLLDVDKDGLLTARETLRGLRELNNHAISDRETKYVLALLDLLDPTSGGGLFDEFEELFASHHSERKVRTPRRQIGVVSFKIFALIGAFSERVVALEPSLKADLNRMDLEEVRRRLHQCRRMFLAHFISGATNALTLDELEVELRAGGLDDVGRAAVLQHVLERKLEELSFLDYLAYMPLWTGIHHAIVSNPIHPHFDHPDAEQPPSQPQPQPRSSSTQTTLGVHQTVAALPSVVQGTKKGVLRRPSQVDLVFTAAAVHH